MLHTIRLTLAIAFFALITLLFLDFTGTLHAWLGWMAQIQFLPAVLALNVGVVAALALLTLLCGRVYCSVICPLGVFQDIVSWLRQASHCIGCNQCSPHCPQSIDIPKELHRIDEYVEKLKQNTL